MVISVCLPVSLWQNPTCSVHSRFTDFTLAMNISSRILLASSWPANALLLTGCLRSLHTGLLGRRRQLALSRVSFWGSYRCHMRELTNMPKIISFLGLCQEISHSILNHLISASLSVHRALHSRPAFLNRRVAARYRALALIIPGRERFSWNLSFYFSNHFAWINIL
jgi:hypothetical protein